MNRKQRMQNRATNKTVKKRQICPECGEQGPHYISLPYSLQDMFDHKEPEGFWTCDKFYGADGRRITQGGL